MADERADSLRARFDRVLITGAGGQLGAALAEVFPWADALGHGELDVSREVPAGYDLILHAAAWTDVDGAESDPEGAEAANVLGTRNVAASGAPVVYFSSDYVFDGAKAEPYVESDRPARSASTGGRSSPASARCGTAGSSAPPGCSARPATTSSARCCGSRRQHDEVPVVDDQRGSPTYVGYLAAAIPWVLDLPYGIYHVAADGDCTWADFAEAIFAERGLARRVRRITTAELGRPAPRPAYSVLRSEHPETPRLPHWRMGLAACLARL